MKFDIQMFATFSFTITYDSNGGVIDGSYTTKSMLYNNRNSNVGDDINSFIRNGYTFVNWCISPDGLGLTYTSEDTVGSVSTDTQDIRTSEGITLYAIWVPNYSRGDILTDNIYYHRMAEAIREINNTYYDYTPEQIAQFVEGLDNSDKEVY